MGGDDLEDIHRSAIHPLRESFGIRQPFARDDMQASTPEQRGEDGRVAEVGGEGADSGEARPGRGSQALENT
jgi:hypothetical protein